MRMKVGLALAIAGVLVAGVALGQDDPIKARQAVMQKNQDAAKIAFDMAGGKTPFDATAAVAAMTTIEEDMILFPTLFPEGSDQGKTSASPAIWENMDDFKALAAKLIADAKTAGEAAAGGVDAFKTALDTVGADCGACHQKYRLRK